MWEYVLGGATIFGVIVGSFSVYNGRATRKVIAEVITEEGRRTREVLREHGEILKKHGEILDKLSEQHATMIEILRMTQIDEK